MPRAKPKRGQPFFQIKPFRLSNEIKEELINLLGFDESVADQAARDNKAVSAIEHYIGRYLGIAEVNKHLPGPASLIAELKRFKNRDDFRTSAFADLHPWLQQKFQAQGFDQSVTKYDPDTVKAHINDIIESLSGEHQGRPENRPFKDLVTRLRRIFRGFRQMDVDEDALTEYAPADNLFEALDPVDDKEESLEVAYEASLEWRARLDAIIGSGGQTARQRQGNVQNRSTVEADELEFITLILETAGLHVPKNFPDLLKKIGRAPQDRAEVLNRIARRAKKRQSYTD